MVRCYCCAAQVLLHVWCSLSVCLQPTAEVACCWWVYSTHSAGRWPTLRRLYPAVVGLRPVYQAVWLLCCACLMNGYDHARSCWVMGRRYSGEGGGSMKWVAGKGDVVGGSQAQVQARLQSAPSWGALLSWCNLLSGAAACCTSLVFEDRQLCIIKTVGSTGACPVNQLRVAAAMPCRSAACCNEAMALPGV